eukprot:3090598-Amphidinium_carterae.1
MESLTLRPLFFMQVYRAEVSYWKNGVCEEGESWALARALYGLKMAFGANTETAPLPTWWLTCRRLVAASGFSR